MVIQYLLLFNGMKVDRELELESRLTKVETTLSEIKDNHLVHLSADIKSLEQRIDTWGGRLENKINKINLKLAYYSGGVVVVLYILQKIFLK